ncbi:MAG: hypothetical protein V8S23_08395 [Lachnospiraceae bacterium]
MKRVLFIAEMNEIVKNMNEAMLPYFQVQLCIADAGMAGQLLLFFSRTLYYFFKPIKQGRCDGVFYWCAFRLW